MEKTIIDIFGEKIRLWTMRKEDEETFKRSIEEKIEDLDKRVSTSENLQNDYKKNFLLLCSLVNMSNMYRRASEKLIDEFFTKNNE